MPIIWFFSFNILQGYIFGQHVVYIPFTTGDNLTKSFSAT